MNKLLITLCASSLVLSSFAGPGQSREKFEEPEMSPERKASILLEDLDRELTHLNQEHDVEVSRRRLNVDNLKLLNKQASFIINTAKENAASAHLHASRSTITAYMKTIENWVSKEAEALKNFQPELTQNDNSSKLQELSSLNEELYSKASELNTLRTKLSFEPFENSFKTLRESQTQQVPAILGSDK